MSLPKFLISKAFFKQIGLSLLILLGLIFLLRWWLGYTTNHDQGIEVPDLQKKTIAEVEEQLNKIDLRYVVVDSASYNPDFPKKSVLEQNPIAGDLVKENRKIYLTLNPSKYRDIAIPDLNGKTRRQAETHLRSIGFKVGKKITWVPDIGKNVVRGLKHEGKQVGLGDKRPKNSTIDLILGDGNGN